MSHQSTASAFASASPRHAPAAPTAAAPLPATSYQEYLQDNAVDPDRRNVWDWNHLNDSKVLASGKGQAEVLSKRASVKYFGWVSYLMGLWTQLAWALA